MLCAVLSLAVVVAEAAISSVLPNLSVFSLALHRVGGSEVLAELLVFLSLLYPCACAYFSLYRLGRWDALLCWRRVAMLLHPSHVRGVRCELRTCHGAQRNSAQQLYPAPQCSCCMGGHCRLL